MSFTINHTNEPVSTENDRPVDLYVTPEVDTATGDIVIRIPLAKLPDHIGVTRDKETGKITGAGVAVKLNPMFSLSGSMEARCDGIAKVAGERYDKSTALAVTLAPSSRGLWLSAKVSADLKPRK